MATLDGHGQNFPPGTLTADPALIHALQQAKAQPNTSQFIQKLIGFFIALLTGQSANLQESGDWSKSQTVQILGTTYTIAEVLNGSVEITATPQ